MKNFSRRLRTLAVAAALSPVVLACVSAHAQIATLQPPEIAARNYMLVDMTANQVLAIKDEDELLNGDQRLQQSIRLRNPYVDPISLLQVELLARWRTAGRPDDDLLNALVATVNGIAAGVQNTG